MWKIRMALPKFIKWGIYIIGFFLVQHFINSDFISNSNTYKQLLGKLSKTLNTQNTLIHSKYIIPTVLLIYSLSKEKITNLFEENPLFPKIIFKIKNKNIVLGTTEEIGKTMTISYKKNFGKTFFSIVLEDIIKWLMNHYLIIVELNYPRATSLTLNTLKFHKEGYDGIENFNVKENGFNPYYHLRSKNTIYFNLNEIGDNYSYSEDLDIIISPKQKINESYINLKPKLFSKNLKSKLLWPLSFFCFWILLEINFNNIKVSIEEDVLYEK